RVRPRRCEGRYNCRRGIQWALAIARQPRWPANFAVARQWRKPTYWPYGVRCAGGVTFIRAFAWNLRTWPTMPREKAQAAETARPKVPMRRPGADRSVVARKRGNARGAKGAGHRRWERANWQQEELQFSTEGGSLRSVARAG